MTVVVSRTPEYGVGGVVSDATAVHVLAPAGLIRVHPCASVVNYSILTI